MPTQHGNCHDCDCLTEKVMKCLHYLKQVKRDNYDGQGEMINYLDLSRAYELAVEILGESVNSRHQAEKEKSIYGICHDCAELQALRQASIISANLLEALEEKLEKAKEALLELADLLSYSDVADSLELFQECSDITRISLKELEE